jgi:AcrR family transcriptional regulator
MKRFVLRSPAPRQKPPEASVQAADRRLAKGNATRDLILVTAERLFAEHGIDAVSLRDIADAAGQKNKVVVQYHFGDKESLAREIAATRLRAIDKVSTDILTKSFATGKAPGVEDYVTANVMSLASNMEKNNYFLPFILRYMVDWGSAKAIQTEASLKAEAQFRHVLRELLPDVPDPILEERRQTLVGSVVHALASYQRALNAGTQILPLDDFLDDLVRFHTAALQAPPRTTRKKRTPRN